MSWLHRGNAFGMAAQLDRLGRPIVQPIPVAALSRHVRATHGWSMAVLGRRIGCDQRTVWALEHGRMATPLHLYARLWRLYHRAAEVVA